MKLFVEDVKQFNPTEYDSNEDLGDLNNELDPLATSNSTVPSKPRKYNRRVYKANKGGIHSTVQDSTPAE